MELYSDFFREIILVDDGSTMEHLKDLENRFQGFPKVKIVRAGSRIGLIRWVGSIVK